MFMVVVSLPAPGSLLLRRSIGACLEQFVAVGLIRLWAHAQVVLAKNLHSSKRHALNVPAACHGATYILRRKTRDCRLLVFC